GSQAYLIQVVMSSGCNYTNNGQADADKSASVVVSKPAATSQVIGGGTIASLSSAAGTYAGTGSTTDSIGLQYNKSGTNIQGTTAPTIRQAAGSTVYIKSNSISSMAVSGKTATIYTKASIYKDVNGTSVAIDGGVSLRVDVDTSGATPKVGFTAI